MSWSELDTALKARAQADSGNELLYFDTKCSAFYEACELPKKLSSTNIRVIAADQPSTTMVDRSDSPMRAMLEGILEQEDYEAIGQRLKKARGSRRGEDNYVLPGTQKYDQGVGKAALTGGAVEWVELTSLRGSPRGDP